jgi:DNA-binding HxlR family transcriptional regulator
MLRRPPVRSANAWRFLAVRGRPASSGTSAAGSHRFGELRIDMPTISPKMLSARLKALESKGIIQRTVVPTSPPSVEYSLTELRRELVPAISAIVAIGLKLKSRPRAGKGLRRA